MSNVTLAPLGRMLQHPPALAIRIGRMLLGTPGNAILTILFLTAIGSFLPGLFRWAVLEAVIWPLEPAACRNIEGACWSFLIAKSGQLLFGIYPPDERWRPTLVCVLILGLLAASVRPQFWRPALALVWIGLISAVLTLMAGGVLGLREVPTASWGGLPITLMLTVLAIGVAFPLSILLALGRRSDHVAISALSTLFIETIRGLPLLSLLLVASIMLPIFLPDWMVPDKFVRALVALTLFAAAYLAEIIRGGLQALPKGQEEAAKSMGLGYWRTQQLVILPQAIRMVIPALANTIIVMVKNTSLVLVVGLFDLISSGKAALSDPNWPSPAAETYLFIGAIYFALAFGFARFADFLERRGQIAGGR
ncbi:MAG: amino acid ABC transporter permease [Elsteraceae bacterium]